MRGWPCSHKIVHCLAGHLASCATRLASSRPATGPRQSNGPLAATGATELRDVGRGRIWIFLHGRQILLDDFEGGARYPAKQSADDKILVRVHFYVVGLGVSGRLRAGRKNPWLPLRPAASGMNVGEVDAPLFPARGSLDLRTVWQPVPRGTADRRHCRRSERPRVHASDAISRKHRADSARARTRHRSQSPQPPPAAQSF